MQEKVMEMLNDICGAEDGELEPELDMFEAGLLDSFGVIRLIVELEERFHIAFDIEQLPREEISTPAKVVSLVERTI